MNDNWPRLLLFVSFLVVCCAGCGSSAPGETPAPTTVPLLPTPTTLPTALPTLRPTAPSPEEQLTRYAITATVDMDRLEVRGEEVLAFQNNTGDTLDRLVFRLYANATAIYGEAQIAVDSAEVGGVPADLILDEGGTVLVLRLPQSLAPGDTVTATLTFTTYPSRGISGYGVLSYADGVLVLGGWYPLLAIYGDDGWDMQPVPLVGDAVTSQIAEYALNIDAPADMAIVATGTTVGTEVRGERAIWQLEAGLVRDFALALSSRWTQHTARVGGILLNLYTLPGGAAAISQQDAMEIALGAVAVYLARFGPYPYAELDVVEANIPIGGYEYPQLVLIEAIRRFEGPYASLEFVMAHELGHQWWYGVVGNDVVREPWLDEALANYGVILYREATYGPEVAAASLASWTEAYVADAGGGPVNQPATAFSGWPAYRGAVYYKGALFWEDLRAEMGDQAFFSLIQRFYLAHQYEIITSADWLAAAREIGGPEVEEVFGMWGVLARD